MATLQTPVTIWSKFSARYDFMWQLHSTVLNSRLFILANFLIASASCQIKFPPHLSLSLFVFSQMPRSWHWRESSVCNWERCMKFRVTAVLQAQMTDCHWWGENERAENQDVWQMTGAVGSVCGYGGEIILTWINDGLWTLDDSGFSFLSRTTESHCNH